MSNWQCSRCLHTYSFQESVALSSVWLDPEQQRFGKTAVCTCGARFGLDTWRLQTQTDGYFVSTMHMELAQISNVLSITEPESEYWYETMIFDQKNVRWLSFQTRYKTQKDAEEGHALAIKLLPNIIIAPDKYPTDLISQAMNMLEGRRKR